MVSAESDDENEEPSEPVCSLCDSCNNDFPSEELEECPASFEEIEHGITVNKKFCQSCCRDIFESEGCQGDVGNCDRATEIMAERIKEYAEKEGFSLFSNEPRVYIDKFRLFCLADNDISVEDVFGDKMIRFPDESYDFFEGKESLIVKAKDKRHCFLREMLDDITRVFEKLGCHKDHFGFLIEKGLLAVIGDGMWGVFTPKEDESDYYIERSSFIEDTKLGYRFFDVGKKDGLVLVHAEMMQFNWSQLTYADFVRLCFDIFGSFPQIKEPKVTEGTGDLGQDIEAFEIVNSLTGTVKRKWTIQCKHFPSRKVGSTDIAEILNSYAQLKFDVFCLMTSNLLLPSCRRMLEEWDARRDFPFSVAIWDREKIENYVRNMPEIFARYFSK